MAGLLEGKVAFITGAGRGQGRAHATTCAREGADVILVDVAEPFESLDYETATPEDLAETVRQVEALDRRALAVEADVRSQAQLDDAVARGIAEFGQIDILIANAGIFSDAPFWKLTEQKWDEMIAVNLTGVWKSAKAVAPHMIERQAGSMVLISSTNGLEPGRNYAHYTAAKHGVVGLMRTIALEVARFGIRCNSVHPGAIDTPMTNRPIAFDMYAGHPGGTYDDFLNAGYAFHALKGKPFMPAQVIADAALFLNSDLAGAITGVTLPVDAGHLLIPGINMSPVR
jgi:SDR family mycofactocin-dependent oxidoreductase